VGNLIIENMAKMLYKRDLTAICPGKCQRDDRLCGYAKGAGNFSETTSQSLEILKPQEYINALALPIKIIQNKLTKIIQNEMKSINFFIKRFNLAFTVMVMVLCLGYNLLCTTGARAQTPDRKPSQNDLVALSQKSAADAAGLFYAEIKDFDRECFLTGTMDLDTADSESVSDTMAYQRIISYGEDDWHTDLALIVVSLFKKDYPDFRALRVCTRCCPPKRYYGSEILSFYDPEDSICKRDPSATIVRPAFEIELYSPSLAKITAGYYNNGVINKEKIATRAQKLSFLAGVFMRYGCDIEDNADRYSISVLNSPNTATVCSEILKELGCEHVDISPKTTQILCTLSADVRKIKSLIYNVHKEAFSNLIAF
jgi:hypothetical protein